MITKYILFCALLVACLDQTFGSFKQNTSNHGNHNYNTHQIHSSNNYHPNNHYNPNTHQYPTNHQQRPVGWNIPSHPTNPSYHYNPGQNVNHPTSRPNPYQPHQTTYSPYKYPAHPSYNHSTNYPSNSIGHYPAYPSQTRNNSLYPSLPVRDYSHNNYPSYPSQRRNNSGHPDFTRVTPTYTHDVYPSRPNNINVYPSRPNNINVYPSQPNNINVYPNRPNNINVYPSRPNNNHHYHYNDPHRQDYNYGRSVRNPQVLPDNKVLIPEQSLPAPRTQCGMTLCSNVFNYPLSEVEDVVRRARQTFTSGVINASLRNKGISIQNFTSKYDTYWYGKEAPDHRFVDSNSNCKEHVNTYYPLEGFSSNDRTNYYVVNVPSLRQGLTNIECESALQMCSKKSMPTSGTHSCRQMYREEQLLVLPSNRRVFNVDHFELKMFYVPTGCACVASS